MDFRALTLAICLPIAAVALMARHPGLVDEAIHALRTGIGYVS